MHLIFIYYSQDYLKTFFSFIFNLLTSLNHETSTVPLYPDKAAHVPVWRRERAATRAEMSVTRHVSAHVSAARSSPASPVRGDQPLHWFVRDIDIGDTADTRSDCGAR